MKNNLIETLNLPRVGFGTYELQSDICVQAVQEALNVGYRYIDTATFYFNLEAIGAATKGFPRKKK